MITVKNLNFAYKKGRPILRDLSFSLKQGFTVLVGENGSGKSTLMKAITTSEYSNAKILLDGVPLSHVDIKKHLAYLPQEFDVYRSLKVNQLLAFVAEAKGVSKQDVKKCVTLAAKKANITECLNNKVKQCSIGTIRRIGIATALLGDPELIILDEPTAGLDPKERVRFYHNIKACFTGKIVLISTHILDDMEILADNILMLSKGRIIFEGEFLKFKHSLDGKVFRLCSLQPECKILSTEPDGTKIKYHVYCEDLSLKATDAEEIEPTLEDIWEYYQGVRENG